MPKKKVKKNHRNCLRCKVIDCFKLFDDAKESVDAGNELYVYSILGKKIDEKEDLAVHVCTNGIFLIVSCFLTTEIASHNKENYLGDILCQVVRDFKASIFLAFSGHYRQAMQVLRCGFENIISGVYYYTDLLNLKKNQVEADEIARLNQTFENWKKGGSQTNINNSIEVLRRIGFLSFKEKKEWQNLYALLSKFIHTPEEFVTRIEHGGKFELKGEITCAAATYYSEKQLIEWSTCYQKVFTILLKAIAEFHSETFYTESGKIAVKYLREEIDENEKLLNVSNDIKQILSTLNSSE